MLTPDDRNFLKNSRIARYYEMERQFDLVTAIYPGQILRTYVHIYDIIRITNCTQQEATDLINEIGIKELYTNNWRIKTSILCDRLDIDEMFVQVFLASLYLDEQPLPPQKRLPALSREQIERERLRCVLDLSEQLREGILENTKTYALRAKRYEEANPIPDGEIMYKRIKWVQMVIRAFEVAQIYKCHIKTAQAMLREVREKERLEYPGSKLRRHVSIRKFCSVMNEDEADLRKHLAELHGENDDEDEYD